MDIIWRGCTDELIIKRGSVFLSGDLLKIACDKESVIRYLQKTGHHIYDVTVRSRPAAIGILARKYVCIGEFTSCEILEAAKTGQGRILSILSLSDVQSLVDTINTEFNEALFASVGIKSFGIYEKVFLCVLRKTDRIEWPLGSVLPMNPQILKAICQRLIKKGV